eukprot:gb/GECH01013778.1/.p1 GENE.gb/GECH01013778.1/~~gb/GECH01013778.1/.p1  ORF type:complete len:373 (+),score=95.37 gb/GECH01013778.1/:1-1119(+)
MKPGKLRFLCESFGFVVVFLLYRRYKRRENGVASSVPTALVKQLNVYPVKSCAGFSVSKWPVCSRGLKYDRRWMIIRKDNHRFITQRQSPEMCLIEPKLIPNENNNTLNLTLSAPNKNDLILERALDPEVPGRQRFEVKIWKDICDGIDMGEKASEWLSEYLGVECQLVMFPPDFIRPVDPKFVKDIKNPNIQKHTGFADGYSFLLLSEESLTELNQRLPQPVPMDRFRPNIVVQSIEGLKPHFEDYWKDIVIGPMRCAAVKPCQRCRITTVDPDTGEMAHREPLATLRSYRQSKNKIFKNGPLFGMNLVHEYLNHVPSQEENGDEESEEFMLRVRDPVHVASSRPKEEVSWIMKGGRYPVRAWLSNYCPIM